jgi:hypothetical protein
MFFSEIVYQKISSIENRSETQRKFVTLYLYFRSLVLDNENSQKFHEK